MSEKTQKKSWFNGVSKEFKKIVWPDKMEITRQTAAVVITSVVLGVIIALIDFLVQGGVDILIGLG